MVFIHKHSSNLRLNLSICRHYSAVLSTKVLCATPSKLGISRHLASNNSANKTPFHKLQHPSTVECILASQLTVQIELVVLTTELLP